MNVSDLDHQTSENYLSMDFTWCGDVKEMSSRCIICDEKLSNESIVYSKFQFNNKFTEYLRGLLKCKK